MRGAILVSDEVEEVYAAELEAAAPGVPRLVTRVAGPPPDPAAVEIAYFSGDLFPERAREIAVAALKATELGWLHSFSAGVDDAFFQMLLERGVRVTNSSGAQAVPIAHTAMMYLLALSRDLRGWSRDQDARHWNPRGVRDLQGMVLAVVGMGPIGLEVAKLGGHFGMQVIGLRRKPRGDEPCETWSLTRLDDALARADAVVLALPLAPETERMFDAKAFARMQPGTLFVNVGRGEVVDERALVEALQEGRIGGAGLDVFAEEPLPEASPLWTLPQVIVTPHSSGTNPGNHHRATQIFLDNLGRYVRGEPLRNEVSGPPR